MLPTAMFIALVWGLTPMIHKYYLTNISADTLMILNGLFYGIAIFVLALASLPRISQDIARLQRHHVIGIACTAFVGLFLANYLYFHVLKKHQSFVVSALVSSAPLFTLLFGYIFLKERVTWNSLLGVLFIVVGVILLTHHSAYDT